VYCAVWWQESECVAAYVAEHAWILIFLEHLVERCVNVAVSASLAERRWTWRQSEKGKVGPDATSALIPIDGFTDKNHDAVLAARDHLAHLIADAFGCRVSTGLASAANPCVELTC
jgi:hypothetical protein